MNNLETALANALKDVLESRNKVATAESNMLYQERRTKKGKAEYDRLYDLRREARQNAVWAEEAAEVLLKSVNIEVQQ
jgi:hypothetical protein